ncbi:UPF0496 protein At4g34320-like [Macadamia integrifolia]|uniref:UPF0496 protein At4g34320-like n=1 Tax=Macadamia integrifolia TaxID=60698 RepID=UPI001C5025C6|nr:UPF0496 protein At4g34320-like [Macadamia integrifolia]XP_042508849.1 UPF0496 protein At4g34320-like [Macadamia integrifolia]XP_042508850.1 UPF0496 protein At4g34320-like [Macadamia integrifolia]XP_042508851.1 UPF0496 protein At4g34320-like [Macadamia integrifolia]XP_042508852.1 UPF0496 protein At4g34320-like [Macadamia integrifolia]XP_042508853.1 UPF0496 protein At4g34320-like [Macadamia integrifolia]
MGVPFSKRTGEAPPVLHLDTNLQYTAELSSYEAECRLDPDLQSFDSILQARTNRVINTVASGVEVRALSFETLTEVTGSLLEMNQEVVNVILDCKKDIWNNQELFGLVEDYFENSLQTLDFCTSLEKCLKKARDSQLILHVALQQFEKEDGVGDKKYLATMEELKNFKAAGNPFMEDFIQEFHTVYRHQVLMLKKLQIRKDKLDKKLTSVKAYRKVSSIIFAATFAALLICSVVAAAMAAPPVAAAMAAATSIPIGAMGKWFNSLWQGYENAVKGQKEVISTMQVGTYVAIKDLESIRVLVERLEIEIHTLMENADFALREGEAVKIGVEEIKRKLEGFMKCIEDLSEQADRCSRDVRRARTVVLQKIIKHPNN